jgi:hypothetical protein
MIREFVKLSELQLGDSCLIGRRGDYIYDASTTADHAQATVVGVPIGIETRTIVEIPDWGSNIRRVSISSLPNIRSWRIGIASDACGKFIALYDNTIVGVDRVSSESFSSYPIPFIPSNEVIVGDTISWAKGSSLFYMFVEDIEESENGSEARVAFTGECYSNIRSRTSQGITTTKSLDPKTPVLLINRGSKLPQQEES